jgi:hypothetical protein
MHKIHAHTYLITNRILPYNFTILHSTGSRHMKDEWRWPISTLCCYISKHFHIQTVKKSNNLVLYIFRTTGKFYLFSVQLACSIYSPVTAHEIKIIIPRYSLLQVSDILSHLQGEFFLIQMNSHSCVTIFSLKIPKESRKMQEIVLQNDRNVSLPTSV